jgi:hypothetical protein
MTTPGAVRPFTNRFIGRTRELHSLDERFASGVRVVALIGTAGVGKTRLGTEYALRLARTSPATQVRWCDLTEARTALDICAALARTLDWALPPGASLARTHALLARALRGQGPLLVVFDNFEDVAAHALATVGAWLDAVPDLRCVVTSRQVLAGVDGAALGVEPLSLEVGPGDEMSEAVTLFLERARESCARPDALSPVDARSWRRWRDWMDSRSPSSSWPAEWPSSRRPTSSGRSSVRSTSSGLRGYLRGARRFVRRS